MDQHIEKYYHCSGDEDSPRGNFHEVIAIHNALDLPYDELLKKIPSLPRGWYELAQLNKRDRIEFTRDFWLLKLPYKPVVDRMLNRFFSSLDDIGIFIFQRSWGDPFSAEMVYSLSNDGGFYRGAIPAKDTEIESLQKMFPRYFLPEDYVAFLQIHNGFCKATDCTGIMPLSSIYDTYLELQSASSSGEELVTEDGKSVDPTSLIPFYESFGMPFYQCFWGEWYPEQEMGNVYYSAVNRKLYNITSESSSPEAMAFATFIEWLTFYLDRIA